MRKIVTLCLVLTMLLSALPVWADEPTDAAATEPETAAQTEQTQEVQKEEPEILSGVLLKAVNLLKALSIAKGYEDGTFKPANDVTRAEYAAFVARMLRGGMAGTSDNTGAVREVVKETEVEKTVEVPPTEEGGTPTTQTVKETVYEVEYVPVEKVLAQPIFTDVPIEHWASDDIRFLYDMHIIHGMGDGTFCPDAPVAFQDAVKMTVCALGAYYGDYAQANGGYPTGYITKAGELGLLKNLQNKGTDPANRGETAILLFNALTADYLVIDTMKGSKPQYKTDETILSYIFNIKKRNATVTGNMASTLTGAPGYTKENEIVLDDTKYQAIDASSQEYLGYYVTAYVEEADEDGEYGTLYLAFPYANAKIVTLGADEIDRADASKVQATLSETNENKSYTLSRDPVVIYNGTAFTGDFASEAADLLTPDFGTVTLVSPKGQAAYSLIVIDNSYYQVVRSVNTTDKRLYFMDNTYLDFNTDKNDDLHYTLSKDNKDITLGDFVKEDTVKVTEGNNYTRVVSYGKRVVTGKVTAKSAKAFTVDGVSYEYLKAIEDDFKIGKGYIFYLTEQNKAFFVEETTLDAEHASLQYGVLISAGSTKNSSSSEGILSFKIFCQDGQMHYLDSTADMKYNGKRMGKTENGQKLTVLDVIANLKTTTMVLANGNTVAVKQENGSTVTRQNPFLQLIKYKENETGTVTELYTSAYNNEDTFKEYGTFRGTIVSNGIIQTTSYALDKAIVFNIPNWRNPLDSDYKILNGIISRDADLDDYIVYDVNKDLFVGAAVTHSPRPSGSAINLAGVMKYFIELEEAQAPKAGEDEPVDGAMLYFYDTGAKKSVFVEKSNTASYTLAHTLQTGDCFYYSTTSPDGFLSDFEYDTGSKRIWRIADVIESIENAGANTELRSEVDALNSTTNFYQFMYNVARIVSIEGNDLVLSTNTTSDDISYQFCTTLGKGVYVYDVNKQTISAATAEDFDPGEYVILRRNSYQFGDIMLLEGM